MSKIECINSNGTTIRSKRSELMSFFCVDCGVVHEDYPIKNTYYIDDDIGFMCKKSVDKLLNE